MQQTALSQIIGIELSVDAADVHQVRAICHSARKIQVLFDKKYR